MTPELISHFSKEKDQMNEKIHNLQTKELQ